MTSLSRISQHFLFSLSFLSFFSLSLQSFILQIFFLLLKLQIVEVTFFCQSEIEAIVNWLRVIVNVLLLRKTCGWVCAPIASRKIALLQTLTKRFCLSLNELKYFFLPPFRENQDNRVVNHRNDDSHNVHSRQSTFFHPGQEQDITQHHNDDRSLQYFQGEFGQSISEVYRTWKSFEQVVFINPVLGKDDHSDDDRGKRSDISVKISNEAKDNVFRVPFCELKCR